ncbi:Non-classical phosphatidylinositol transfer protein (PITP) [Steccherinum ochraceum]|uniref:Phosphatidylinositol transfer protein SFH5 n=1 Tax=Steccherinum ochraceum TaxID=92696 RepID=A0A4R0RQJ3_9APHY|nr:Non-classical phosphatidylinositol transfer protein (PITP) [Steccherinum ochraceum]
MSEPTATNTPTEPQTLDKAIEAPTQEAASKAGPEPTSALTEEHPPTPLAEEAPQEPADDTDEPENELTKKFTLEEWKALKEFRTQLPEVFAKAFHPDDASARAEPITLWGVSIDPQAPKSDARVSVLLMKFLRARNLNVAEAHDMLTATLKWRTQFKIDEIMNEKFDDTIFGGVGYVTGHDKEGRPVKSDFTYNLYGGSNIKTVFSDVPRFIRWRVQLMERSIELLDFEKVDQMVQIHDYAGVSFLGGRDANQKAAAAEATNIFQNHYPEFLSSKFFINVPTLLTWIFWLFKPLVSAKTFAKMQVVGTSKSTISAALLPIIDKSELPARYGGDAKDLTD